MSDFYDLQKLYDDVVENSYNKYINTVFFEIYEGDITIEEAKNIFILFLRELTLTKKVKIIFRDWVENKTELENSSLEEQLSYIYQSFPTEYDENDPEKDIENLWWYFGCPVDIGWLQPDGSYWFS